MKKSIIEIVKHSIREQRLELKQMFLPEKNVRRQFWIVIVGMFLAVLGSDVFLAIIRIIRRDVQPHIGILVSVIAFSVLLLVFLILYLVGLPLIYFGEKYIIREHNEQKGENTTEPIINNEPMEEVNMEVDIIKEQLAFHRLWIAIFYSGGLTGAYVFHQGGSKSIFIGFLTLATLYGAFYHIKEHKKQMEVLKTESK